MNASPPPHQASIPATAEEPTLRVWRSEELFDGAREILIAHHGGQYRLRITNQRKLILTK